MPRAFARCLRTTVRFAAYGAVTLGGAALINLAWQLYKVRVPAGTPVDDPFWTAVSFTVIGVFAGAILGGALGIVVGLAKGGSDDSAA